MPGIHDGHRERMLAKFSQNGFHGMKDHEKLEIILFFSIPRHDTNELAHLLLNRYHTVSAVMDAPEKELLAFPHITKRTCQLFQMIKETSVLYRMEKGAQKEYMTTLDEIGTYFLVYYGNCIDEKLTVMSLNNKRKFLSCDVVGEGDISSVGVSTRKVVETVLRTRASEVVLCHNHPGGIALPSKADICITEMIRDILEPLGIHLIDHIIVAGEDYVSLASSAAYRDIFIQGH